MSAGPQGTLQKLKVEQLVQECVEKEKFEIAEFLEAEKRLIDIGIPYDGREWILSTLVAGHQILRKRFLSTGADGLDHGLKLIDQTPTPTFTTLFANTHNQINVSLNISNPNSLHTLPLNKNEAANAISEEVTTKQPPPLVDQVVLLIHGIRDQAEWEEIVTRKLEEIPGVKVEGIKYEYLDVVSFLFPFVLRQKKVVQVLDRVRHARRIHPGAKVSVIAHSFGTYIIGKILAQNPDIILHRLILCGAILPRSFRWNERTHQVVSGVVNDCGVRDIWPIMAQSLTFGFGASGAFGFGYPGVKDRFHDFGHGGFFEEAFIEKFWKSYIVNCSISPGIIPPPRPYLWSLITVLQIKILLIAILFMEFAPRYFPWMSSPTLNVMFWISVLLFLVVSGFLCVSSYRFWK